MNSDMLISILTAIAGVIGGGMSLIFEIVVRFLKDKKNKQQGKEDIAVKIKAISDSLNKTAAELIDMQEQLKVRIAFVEDLNEQAQKAENIASLNKEQINAVNAILSANLRKEGRKGFWQGVAVNFVFFILGALVSYLLAVYIL